MNRKNAVASSIPVTEPSILPSSSQSAPTRSTGHETHSIPASETLRSIPAMEPGTSPQGYLTVDSDIQVKEETDYLLIGQHHWDNRAPLFQGLYAIKQEPGDLKERTHTRFTDAGVPGDKRKRLIQQISAYKRLDDDARADYLNNRMKAVTINDPEQPELKGQSGVLTACDLDAWTLLGHYAGRAMLEKDFKTNKPELLGGTSLAINTYSTDTGNRKVFLSGYRHSNIVSLINASTTYKYVRKRDAQNVENPKGKRKKRKKKEKKRKTSLLDALNADTKKR